MILVDTGPLVAAADDDERHHDICLALLQARRHELIVPASVVVEVGWLIERNLGPAAESAFLKAVARQDDLRVEPLKLVDYERSSELVATYADLGLGNVDASVVAIAERLNISTLLTLNRRDFSVVRPRHVEAFTLLPEQ